MAKDPKADGVSDRSRRKAERRAENDRLAKEAEYWKGRVSSFSRPVDAAAAAGMTYGTRKKPKVKVVRTAASPQTVTTPPPPVPPRVKSPEEWLEDVRARRAAAEASGGKQVDLRDGFVYIVTNPAWPGLIKVGCALDFEERLVQYQTGSPWRDYHMAWRTYVTEREKAESAAHAALEAKRIPTSREWFTAELGSASEAIWLAVLPYKPE